jgi:PAS domain S-box-containing protein
MQHELGIPYRRLFDKLDEHFAILQKIDQPDGKLDFKIVDANPVLATLAGTQVSDLIGKSAVQAFPRDSPQRLQIYEEVRRTGVPVRFERAVVPGRMISVYVFRIEDEAPYRIGVLGKDITDRKTGTRDNEQFLRNILDSTPDYIAVLDREGHVEYWNEAARAAAPADTAQHIGQNWLDLWKDPAERAAAEQAQSSALAGRPSTFDGHITKDDGRTKWWEVLLSSIPPTAGWPIQLLALAREITSRVIAEQTLILICPSSRIS